MTPDQCQTPNPCPPDHDWRNEAWVDHDGPADFDHHLAMGLLTAMAALPPGEDDEEDCDPTDVEDARVLALLHPGLMERLVKSGQVEICNRVAHAMAQHIHQVRAKWTQTYGSVAAPGKCAAK